MLYGKCVRRADPSHDRHTGFADGRVGMRYTLPWFPLSDDSSRCSCRTIRDCRLYRSFLSGCRFASSGSSGFVVSFRRLRLTSRGLAPRVHSFRDQCRYRYICRPKRSGFHLRDCLKGRNCLRSARTLRWD